MTTAELTVQSRGAWARGGSHEVVRLDRGREAVRNQTACVGHTRGGARSGDGWLGSIWLNRWT
jgi:hypothetical protein